MSITIRADHVYCRAQGYLPVCVDAVSSYLADGYFWSKQYKAGIWDGRIRFCRYNKKRNETTFPTGFLTRICQKLDESGYSYNLEDTREYPEVIPCIELFDKKVGKIRLDKGKYQYQALAVEAALSHGRGVLQMATGTGKCLQKGTKVLLYCGTTKNVEDIEDGDLLMGPDSEPREVLSTNSGFGQLYKITPIKGDPWVCNDAHILTLVRTQTGQIMDVPLQQWLSSNKNFKHLWKQFSVGVDFPPQNEELPLDPYFLGVWFGDGTKHVDRRGLCGVSITKPDVEIKDVCEKVAASFGLMMRVAKDKRTLCPTYRITIGNNGGIKGSNRLLKTLRELVGDNTNMPFSYLTSSRVNRLNFLAGLVDTDGYVDDNTIELTQKRADYADGITFLARSLGLKVVRSMKYVPQFDKSYHKLCIFGEVGIIPTRILRKQTTERKQKKNALRTGFSVKSVGDGEYYGFTLDGDGRFLLGDFTVTHNTICAAAIIRSIDRPTIWLTHRLNLAYQTRSVLQERLKRRCGVYCGEEKDVQDITVGLVQSLMNYEKVGYEDIKKHLFRAEVLVADEAHHSSAESWIDVLGAIPAKFRFGLTATPELSGPGLNLLGLTGDIIYNFSVQEGIEAGVLVPPRIWCVEVPEPKKVTGKYAAVYRQGVVENEYRNHCIIQVCQRFKSDHKSTLVLVKQVGHGANITSFLNYANIAAVFISGKMPNDDREKHIKRLIGGEIDVIVAVDSIFAEGTDVPQLRAIVNACGSKAGGSDGDGGMLQIQMLGRGLRASEGKEFFDFVFFNDRCHKSFRDATDDQLETMAKQGYIEFIKPWCEYV